MLKMTKIKKTGYIIQKLDKQLISRVGEGGGGMPVIENIQINFKKSITVY